MATDAKRRNGLSADGTGDPRHGRNGRRRWPSLRLPGLAALRLPALATFAALALAAAGCGAADDAGGTGGGDGPAAKAEPAPEPGPGAYEGIRADGRTFSEIQEFAAGYWVRPIPAQGPAPESWTAPEASLRPSSCALCHPVQHADWRTTLHAGAYSPGLSGQLVNWEESWPGTVQSCLLCHAPLFEQSAWLAAPDGSFPPSPTFDAELRNEGIACAACHVRGRARYGPPRRDGSLGPSPEGSPHGGVTRTPFFEDSRFCAGCHQFAAPAPNGKSIQNTFEEWRASRWAAEGVSCQSCHMPDRRHLWRGIHDEEMVRSGITVEWIGPGLEEGLRIVNSGTGHHFPTYVTPVVHVELQPLGADGEPVEGAERTWQIARRVENQGGTWVELSDTRIAAGDTARFTLRPPAGATAVRGRVRVEPDAVYEGLFEEMLAGALPDTSRALLTRAHRQASSSDFVVFEETLELER